MKKRICRICLVLFGAMIIVDFLAKFVLKDNLRYLVKAYWCRQVIRNQELLSCMKKPCFSWIWYDYAYYCGFYYYDNEEPMEVHDSHYYLSRDMETVEPMWWRSHYKTETEKITDHWWFYEVWAKPSQQVRM